MKFLAEIMFDALFLESLATLTGMFLLGAGPALLFLLGAGPPPLFLLGAGPAPLFLLEVAGPPKGSIKGLVFILYRADIAFQSAILDSNIFLKCMP